VLSFHLLIHKLYYRDLLLLKHWQWLHLNLDDAFIELSMKKDFKDITIKDITSAATVNRATFYSHFMDKFDLLEKVLSESVMREIIQEVSTHEAISEETIKAIFLSIIKFLTSISNQCKRSYEAFTPQIETIFKMELQAFFSEWAHKQWSNQNKSEIEVFAVMLSWALYGAAMHWMQNQTEQPEDYVKQLMPLIKNKILEANSDRQL
jgi:AcrR family transcriptional regulator